MNKTIKEAIEAELKYIDQMNYGESSTTSRIMGILGFESLFMEDLFDIEDGVFSAVEKTRDYVLDKSSHENMLEGLPFNLDFVKKKKVESSLTTEA